MTANNSDAETGDTGPLTFDEGVDQLAGILANSEPATPAEPESEQMDEAPAVEAEAEAESTETEDTEYEFGDDGDVEYEAAEETPDTVAEPDYIEIDGKQVTLDEVGNGYLRQSDYTKKTQELAGQRKAFEQELAGQRKAFEQEQASIAAEREHLKQMLENVGQPQQDVSQEDLARLAEEDPLAYITKKAQMDATNAKQDAVNAERERLSQIEGQQQQAKMAEYVESQKAALDQNIPELKGEQGTAYRADILTYMEGVGFSKNELGQLYDARAVVLADKARKYDALMAKGKVTAKKVRTAPKVVKPGTQTSKKANATNARKQTLARARKSGSVQDATKAIEAMFSGA